jgi:excisionase family DNA binding protein
MLTASLRVNNLPSERPVGAPLSPAQAAQAANVSRRTIMRAIERLELKASRDNRNRWKISRADFDKWADAHCAPSEQAQSDAHTLPTSDLAISLARAEAERDGLKTQLTEAKADRDHWRALAERQQGMIENTRQSGFFKRLFGK